MTIPEKTGVFRYDINGLRAFAVVAVVFYHFGIAGFSGGFIGVDVFFVISGFLMTGIIIRSLQAEQFSLGRFYLARARRILPALIVLCAVLLIAGWFLLLPEEYSDLGKHIRDSLLFKSNNTYAKEAGYFDVASHEKWLLHTWTLSVEWQFYLLLPLFLLAIWKLRSGRQYAVYTLILLFVASLLVSIIKTPEDPAKYFYLLQARIWEMAAGGLVFLLADKLKLISWQRHAVEISGLSIIIVSVILFNSSSLWPGWRALLPVTGTVLVLLAANKYSWWTGNRLAQWLGTRSYSIYLWHWPVVVILTYKGKLDSLEWLAGGLAATLLLSYLSYQLVEAPARKKLASFNSWTAAILILLGVLIVIIPAQIVRRYDLLGRFPENIAVIAAEAQNKNPRRKECVTSGGTSPSCIFGGEEVKAILIGDSHATSTITAVAADPQLNYGVMFWGYNACPTLLGMKYVSPGSQGSSECADFNDWVIEKLKNTPKDIPVILLNRGSIYALGGAANSQDVEGTSPMVYFTEVYTQAEPAFLEEFSRNYIDTVCKIAKDRTVYLVRPLPEMPVDVPKTMASTWLHGGGKKEVSITLAEYYQRHEFIWSVQDAALESCGVKILDPLPYLCDNNQCPGAINGRPLYLDAHHLSEYGNKFLVPMFAPVFNEE